ARHDRSDRPLSAAARDERADSDQAAGSASAAPAPRALASAINVPRPRVPHRAGPQVHVALLEVDAAGEEAGDDLLLGADRRPARPVPGRPRLVAGGAEHQAARQPLVPVSEAVVSVVADVLARLETRVGAAGWP